MTIPTEPIGSIPRPAELVAGMQQAAEGAISDTELAALFDQAVRSTVSELEATGSPVITDGEQRKPSFVNEAGGHLRIGAEPSLPGRRHRRIPASGLSG